VSTAEGDAVTWERRTLGVVGVGAMGGPLAGRMIGAGHDVLVVDLDQKSVDAVAARGARQAPSLRALADEAEAVFVSLPSPAVVRSVISGQEGLTSGSAVQCIVDVSTTGSTMSRAIAADLEGTGIAFVDAPVSGGVAGAAQGRLAVMVAGEDKAVSLVQDVLGLFGTVFRVGSEPGLGQTMKLLNNYLSATALAATSEAFVFGAKAGLDAQTMVDVVNAGSGRNSATQDKFPRAVLPGTFDFGFAINLLCKDLRLFADEAESMAVPLFLGASLRQLWQLAAEQQGAEADFTEIVRPLESWAGVEVRARDC
jgi:2-hydroxy-3-oxopropionate reductase